MRPSLIIAQRLRGLFFRAAVVLSLLVCVGPVQASEDGLRVNSARQKELIGLVRQDCGSCHGMTLAGGLGPALLPAALTGKPAESLVATVLYGRPGTPMPPWGAFLNEDEAKWVVEMLLKGFPNEP